MSSPDVIRTAPARDHRWLILVIVAVAQLMVVLDATVVNIALPSAQHALGFPNSDRQWIVTAYSLAFGSLLLLGGRLGDMFGRKRVFIAGLIGFAVASALGGAATSFGVLVTARALQGAFGAILAPAALGTLVTTFRDPRERGQRVRRVRLGRRRRRRGRPDPRRRAHPVPVLALGHVRQPAVRRGRGGRRGRLDAHVGAPAAARSWTGSARSWPRPACSSWCSASPGPRSRAGPPA